MSVGLRVYLYIYIRGIITIQGWSKGPLGIHLGLCSSSRKIIGEHLCHNGDNDLSGNRILINYHFWR